MTLEPTVRAVVSLTQPMFDAKSIQLIVDSPEHTPVVLADADRVRQILFNLLANAVKFTHRGGTISVVWQAKRDVVELEVRDSGIGIASNQLERIFKPFVQLDTSRTKVGSGFGLGLAISRGLARAMGGDLVARSEEGRGSTFILTLPMPR
jgi:signal transduction histidine kinase